MAYLINFFELINRKKFGRIVNFISRNVFAFIKRIIITHSFNREKKFSRLDGSMHFEDRQQNIDRFNEHPDYKIFLLSTRAGGKSF